jgi:hypothetical protein
MLPFVLVIESKKGSKGQTLTRSTHGRLVVVPFSLVYSNNELLLSLLSCELDPGP